MEFYVKNDGRLNQGSRGNKIGAVHKLRYVLLESF